MKSEKREEKFFRSKDWDISSEAEFLCSKDWNISIEVPLPGASFLQERIKSISGLEVGNSKAQVELVFYDTSDNKLALLFYRWQEENFTTPISFEAARLDKKGNKVRVYKFQGRAVSFIYPDPMDQYNALVGETVSLVLDGWQTMSFLEESKEEKEEK